MNYLTLDELKAQCIIDSDFKDDDLYLESLGDTAESFVEQQVDKPLIDITAENDGVLPMPLKHAMKMLVEYFYNNRGTDNSTVVPDVFYHMCKLYRKY